jgi:LCP family protein required for cell wall assembly
VPSLPAQVAQFPPVESGAAQNTLCSVGYVEGRIRRISTTVAMVLVAALSASLLVYVGVLWQTVRGVNDLHVIPAAGLRKASDEQSAAAHAKNPVFKGRNLLIVGNDDRSGMTLAQARELKVGLDGGSLNTDTMMLVHLPSDGSRATLISLPRDSYVNIPGYGMNKLNAAYALGYNDTKGTPDQKRSVGISLLIRTIKALTGAPIDDYILVSLLGFVRISDAIGGVPINLCHSVDDTVAHNRTLGIPGGSGFKMSKGPHSIHGVQALEFVRERDHLPGTDLGRAARQRYFITSAFRTVTSAKTLLDIGKLHRLIDAVRASIYADQDLKVLELAKELTYLSANNIHGQAIPTDDYQNVTIPGYPLPVNVGIVHPSEVRAFVRHLLAPHKKHKLHRPTTNRKSHNAVDAGCIN